MALGCVGSRLVIVSLTCCAVQVASISKPSELPGNCPLTNPLSCGTTTLVNGDTIALVPKSVTNEDIWLPELDHVITQRLICKSPDCLSSPCENGKICTETLDGFECSCSTGYHGPVCAWTCPESWLYFQGSCYGYFSDWVTFNQALDNCRGMTTEAGPVDLVSIHSLEELEFILCFPRVHGLWIGLYQPNQGLTEPFVWTDGTPVNYTPWSASGPDYTISEGNCVLIYDHGLSVYSWYVYPCENTLPHHICKMIFSQ